MFEDDGDGVRSRFVDAVDCIGGACAEGAFEIAEDDDFDGGRRFAQPRSIIESEDVRRQHGFGFGFEHAGHFERAHILREEEGDFGGEDGGFVTGDAGLQEGFESVVGGEILFRAGIGDFASDFLKGACVSGAEIGGDEGGILRGAVSGEEGEQDDQQEGTKGMQGEISLFGLSGKATAFGEADFPGIVGGIFNPAIADDGVVYDGIAVIVCMRRDLSRMNRGILWR